MTNNKLTLLHLSLIYGVGPKTVLKIVKSFFDSFAQRQVNSQIRNLNINLENLYQYKTSDFIYKFGFSQGLAQKIYEGLQDRSILDRELQLIEKHQIKLFSFLDFDYPEILKEIYLPPIIIYCKGAFLSNDHKKIAIVGARKSNFYAKQVIQNIVPDLIAKKWQIVSGGAIGADSMAHEETLNAGGKTVAVLGSGLLNLYPSSNEKLFERIVDNGGSLVSPFPLQSPPEKGNFPARNRIISGLSQGCLVVQAAKRSGALITAHFALEQGRQVFAIPGPVYDELSIGCHEIIKHGAKIVSCAQDILEEFELMQPLKSNEITDTDSEKVDVVASEVCVTDVDPFVNNLNNPITIDELSVKTGLSLVELQDKLFDLQLDGKIKQNFAGSWQRV